MFPIFLFATLVLGINANPISNTTRFRREIFGAVTDNISFHPFNVAILHGGQLWCSGVVLSRFQVLTSARCVRDRTGHLIVTSGSSYYGHAKNVHLVEEHAIFETDDDADIAILRVGNPFNFDSTCQPALIAPPHYMIVPGSIGILTGWETQREPESTTTQLLAVKVEVIDRATCTDVYSNTPIGRVLDSQICAGVNGAQSAASDAGSPLVIDGYLVGIIFGGYGRGVPHYPTIFTNISYYSKWILKHMSHKIEDHPKID